MRTKLVRRSQNLDLWNAPHVGMFLVWASCCCPSRNHCIRVEHYHINLLPTKLQNVSEQCVPGRGTEIVAAVAERVPTL